LRPCLPQAGLRELDFCRTPQMNFRAGRGQRLFIKNSDICNMTVQAENIVAQFKALVQKLYGERLAKVVLFGSYARGEEKETSDIDFLVVLKDKKISSFSEIEKMNAMAYDIMLKYGKVISFVPTTQEKFDSSPNHFYRLVKEEGKII
jgi:predicted nucleotidyltransferase